MSEHAATCLDSALLYAAALEQAGLNPLIWVPPGHALVGVWLDEGHGLSSAAIAENESEGSVTSAAYNAADAGLMLLVETTSLTRGASFREAVAEGNMRVNGTHEPVMGVVDVRLARLNGVLPLPATRRNAAGHVEVFAYQAGEITVSKPTAPQGQRAPRESDVPVRVQQWKNTLLDLSYRNQLINFRRNRAVSLLIPRSNDRLHPLDFIEDELHQGRPLTLMPFSEDVGLQAARGLGAALSEQDHQTLRDILVGRRTAFAGLDENRYQTALRKLRYESRASVQESGANNLYLALGTLIWDAGTTERETKNLTSPLILVPITLGGGTRNTPFHIALDESGSSTPNFCLLEKLKAEYDLHIPALEVPLEDAAGIAVKDILHEVRLAIAEAGLNMRVDETADLAILQFTKFRLWKDLDDHWRRFMQNPLVEHLVQSPTQEFVAPPIHEQATPLDDLAALCPIPADATQLGAIDRAVRGETFVLEGPPGTGKSQTITNLLARAIAEGRRVLFVAEKRAALDVVQSRLEAVGLGPFCLDLHDKGSKPAVIRQQLLESLNYVPQRDTAGVEAAQGQLRAAVTILSRYRERLHQVNSMGLSLYSAHDLLLAMGTGPSIEISVDEVEALEADDWQRIRAALPEYGSVLDSVHDLGENPWAMAGQTAFESLDRQQLARSLHEVYRSLDEAEQSPLGAECLELAFGGHSLADLRQFISARPLSTAQLDHIATESWRQQSHALVEQIQAYLADPAVQSVTPTAFLLPLGEIHQQALAADNAGVFSRKKKQRLALERLKPGLATDTSAMDPATASAMAGTLSTLVNHLRQTLAALSALEGFGDIATQNPLDEGFGTQLRERWNWLHGCADCVVREWPYRQACRIAAQTYPATDDGLAAADQCYESWAKVLTLLESTTDTVAQWCGESSPLGALGRERDALLQDAENQRFRRLEEWLLVAGILNDLRNSGLASVADAVRQGSIDGVTLQEAVVRGVTEAAMIERSFAGRLDAFDSQAHLRSVQRFSDSSAVLRERMAEEIPADLVRSRPFQAQSLAGEVGALQREINKQRRGMSIRALLKRYGPVITALTPCFLVSPDSIARFLEPGGIDFDLVVFDEASQIRVAESVGAMGRAKAVVVVGDSRQMPPSTFGGTGAALDDEEVEDVVEEIVVDEESILSECVQARVPRQWLAWHYRSQDEALIAFSNHKYYDGRLSSFPAPHKDIETRSVTHVRVDGQFNRGGDRKLLRTNPREAEAVVNDVIARFRSDPNASVGVVTFNVQQRDLIIQLLTACDSPAVVKSIESDEADSLFVKNLENVQGDERDAIIFSLGFSKNDRGILPLNFGPLNRQGGERRLNVAVTRARREVRVFSSFNSSDIRIDNTNSRGIADLHDYLRMAEGAAGAADLGRRHMPPDRHRESIADALREMGWPATTEVGLSDFRIDIAVSSQRTPGRDLCAILLDGPGWASRETVADRDGLPVSVLGGMLKWPSIRRIWLPDWLNDRDRVLAELQDALTEVDAVDAEQAPDTEERGSVDFHEDVELSEFEMSVLEAHPIEQPNVIPDIDHSVPADVAKEFEGWYCQEWLDRTMLDSLDSRSRAQIASTLAQGANAEGPIHVDRLVKLLADGMGIGRLRAERADVIRRLIPGYLPRTEQGTVIWPTDSDPETYSLYRTSYPDERSFQQIPRIELGNAMVPIVDQSMGVSRDELFRLTVREFHAERVTKQVRERLESALMEAIARGRLAEEDGLIVRGVKE